MKELVNFAVDYGNLVLYLLDESNERIDSISKEGLLKDSNELSKISQKSLLNVIKMGEDFLEKTEPKQITPELFDYERILVVREKIILKIISCNFLLEKIKN